MPSFYTLVLCHIFLPWVHSKGLESEGIKNFSQYPWHFHSENPRTEGSAH